MEKADADKALALLKQAIEQWGQRVDDGDEDINGTDAVDWLCAFIQDAQDIAKVKGFKGLLKRPTLVRFRDKDTGRTISTPITRLFQSTIQTLDEQERKDKLAQLDTKPNKKEDSNHE